MLSASKNSKKFNKKNTERLITLLECARSPFESDQAETSLDLEEAMTLVRNGANPNALTNEGHSLTLRPSFALRHSLILHIIASKFFANKVALLNELRLKGAELFKTSDDRTPLHWAARAGDLETCKWLDQQHLSINAKDKEGRSALSCACFYGHLEVAKWLVMKGASLQQLNKKQETLLFEGAMSQNPELMKWLKEAGNLDVDARDIDGRKAIQWSRDEQTKSYLHNESPDAKVQNFKQKYALSIKNSLIFAVKKFFSTMYKLLFVSKKPVTMADVEAHAKAKPSSRTAHIVKVMGLKANNLEAFKAEYGVQRKAKRLNSPFAGTMYKRLAKEPKISMEDIRDHAIKNPSSLTAKVLFKLG